MIEEKIMELKFDPVKSELADIFNHPQATGLWTMYKSWHIISGDGLKYLNEMCRNLIKTPTQFTEAKAEKFLIEFLKGMHDAEFRFSFVSDATIKKESHDWINRTIPYLTGKIKIKLVVL